MRQSYIEQYEQRKVQVKEEELLQVYCAGLDSFRFSLNLNFIL